MIDGKNPKEEKKIKGIIVNGPDKNDLMRALLLGPEGCVEFIVKLENNQHGKIFVQVDKLEAKDDERIKWIVNGYLISREKIQLEVRGKILTKLKKFGAVFDTQTSKGQIQIM